DKVIFSNGITFNQVGSGLTKSGNELILKVNGSNDNGVTLTNFFLGGDHLVESFEFETGGSISAAQIFGAFGLTMPSGEAPAVNTVHGTAGNDTLNGSASADIVAGSHGND
ncbi:calcium-binding protein, partial [Paraburkholderia sp. SIMBA_053]|uniref:calcium-binding protein n=1 Tax=Paraburkholderia sp. SIMBA_053 TaxID=3085794 RepID=UPI00397B2DE6